MKIAFFTDTYLPNTDGVVTCILNLRKEFEKKGHEVYIFTSGAKEDKKNNKDPRVFYHSSIRFPPYPDYKVAVFPFFSVSKLRELNIEIIHSHALATMGLAAIVAAKKLKIPAVETFHTKVSEGTHYITKNKKLQEIGEDVVWKYLKWYASQFDIVTCPSNHTKEILNMHGINAEVYPNGIDTMLFQPISMMKGERKEKYAKIRDEYIKKLDINENTIVLVSRLVKEKNLDLAIRAMPYILKEIKDVKLIIGGKGPAEEELRKLVNSLHLEEHIRFAGFIPHKELPALYSAVKAFVFPSGTFETQGLVALEALACGLPVVGIKHSAVAEVINDKTGEVASNDPQSFAEAVIRVLRNGDKYTGTRKMAEQFSNDKIAQRFLELYERLIELKKQKV